MENITINVQGPYPECPDCDGTMLPLVCYDGEVSWHCSKCENHIRL